MSPRPRKRGSKDLPINLYTNKKGTLTYYRYKHPVTGEFTGFGRDRLKAINAAKQLNQLLVDDVSLVSKVVKPNNTFSDYLTYYLNEVIPKRRIKGYPLSSTTVKEYKRIVNTISKELGHIDITKLSQKDIAGYLEQLSTAEVFNKHRSLLTLIFRQAISDGLIENNIPERVLKRGTEPTKRSRLTLEQYTAIYAVADPAIQNAMELSLNTIQRRTDIKNWRFDAAKDDGFIYLIQSKTRKHGKSAYLRIPVSLPVVHSERSAKTLSDIIKSCRDDFVCPFIIHRPPKRRGIEMAAEKDHLMQLTGDEISKGFAKARDKAGIKVEDGLTLPTFHELLSLGEYLRSQQGWSLKQIQSLRGHTSDKMTKHYLDGHDWTTVETPKCAQ